MGGAARAPSLDLLGQRTLSLCSQASLLAFHPAKLRSLLLIHQPARKSLRNGKASGVSGVASATSPAACTALPLPGTWARLLSQRLRSVGLKIREAGGSQEEGHLLACWGALGAFKQVVTHWWMEEPTW